MGSKSRREAIKERRQRARLRSTLVWGSLALGGIAILGYLVWNIVKPAVGEAVEVQGTNHIEEGTLPSTAYSSDPPTSGPHYSTPLNAGFYDEKDLASIPTPEDGYLIHNLEHGYVILWYNCQALEDETDCSALKSDIRAVMDRFNGVKLIGFPRESLAEPVVLTSWGHIQRLEQFDPDLASRFIRRNRNRAPEATAG